MIYTTTRLEDLIKIRGKIDSLIDRVEMSRDLPTPKKELVKFYSQVTIGEGKLKGEKFIIEIYEDLMTIDRQEKLIESMRNIFRSEQ